jgi:hypothetical protein
VAVCEASKTPAALSAWFLAFDHHIPENPPRGAGIRHSPVYRELRTGKREGAAHMIVGHTPHTTWPRWVAWTLLLRNDPQRKRSARAHIFCSFDQQRRGPTYFKGLGLFLLLKRPGCKKRHNCGFKFAFFMDLDL